MADKEKPSIINPPNTLRTKVGPPGPGGVDVEMLEKADEIVAGMADSYLEWVQEDLKRLQKAYDALAVSGGAKAEADQVFEISHDIKGQGGSFGYDLMTVIGDRLCRFLETHEELGEGGVQVVKLHLDTMKLVISERLTGDGGTKGAQLVDGLDAVAAKISQRSGKTQ